MLRIKHTAQYVFNGIIIVLTRPRRMIAILKNLAIDLRYVRSYLGIPLHNDDLEKGFTQTTSTEYSVLDKLFSEIKILEKDVIVDVGCGGG